MKIEREKIREDLKGVSASRVTIENTIIETPQPMITTTDMNYAETVTKEYEIDPSYENKLHEIRQRLDKNDLSRITNSEDAFNKAVEWIVEQKQKSLAEKFMYTPILKDNVHITKSVMVILLQLQERSGMNLINVIDSPYMDNVPLVEILKSSNKEIKDTGQDAFLQIDARYSQSTFLRKTQIAKDLGFSGITVMDANPLKYFGNYKVLADLKDSSLLRHLSNVERYYKQDKRSAVMPLSLLFADTFSSKLGMGGSSNKKDQGKQNKINTKQRVNARRYDLTTSGYLKASEHKREHGEDLGCLCPIDNGNTLSDVLVEYHKKLYATFRAHEPYAIYTFVDMAREQLKQGRLLAFLKGRKYTPNTLNNVFGIGQTQMSIT